MRCYLLKGGHIVAVEMLEDSDDATCLKQAEELFALKGGHLEAEGYEVWDGRRFVFRFPANLQTPEPPAH